MNIILQNYLDKIKSKGYIITQTRKSILEIFSNHPSPQSASDILNSLKKNNISVDKTTIYRELEFLLNQNLINEVHFDDGKTRYEATDEKHHHHLICNSCGNIKDIDIEESNFLSNIESKSRFRVIKHKIEFFGLCINCQ